MASELLRVSGCSQFNAYFMLKECPDFSYSVLYYVWVEIRDERL